MSLSGSKSAVRETVKGLCAYLLANVSALEEARDEWPSFNQALKMPAVSIYAKTPKFLPKPHYVISRAAASGDSDNRVMLVRKAIGQYDFEMKMDLWCAYKPQRDSLMADIQSAFSQGEVHGINYQLADYFNEWVHYSIDDVRYVEDQTAAERNEWRAIITVMVSVRAVREDSSRIMEAIENNLETPLNIESDPEVDTGLII